MPGIILCSVIKSTFLPIYFFQADSVDAVIHYCDSHKDVLSPIPKNMMVTLEESDVEIIQAILDDSSDDDDYEMFEHGEIPRPFK